MTMSLDALVPKGGGEEPFFPLGGRPRIKGMGRTVSILTGIKRGTTFPLKIPLSISGTAQRYCACFGDEDDRGRSSRVKAGLRPALRFRSGRLSRGRRR